MRVSIDKLNEYENPPVSEYEVEYVVRIRVEAVDKEQASDLACERLDKGDYDIHKESVREI